MAKKEKKRSGQRVAAPTHKRKGKAQREERSAQQSAGRHASHRGAVKGIACTMVRVSGTYGFAQPEGAVGREEDIFIGGRGLAGALPGEQVLVELDPSPRRPGSREGRVLRITGEGSPITGVLEQDGGLLWLRPDFCPELRMVVDKRSTDRSLVGQKVAVNLISRGEDYDEHRFAVQLAFGDAASAKASAGAILYENNVTVPFPEKVLTAAALLQKHAGAVSVTQPGCADAHFGDEDTAGRLDLRGEAIFTIDSASTKDIDDAIHITREGEGWLLGVHIADVSHYVRPYSALDKEALARGTSVYYADQVVPMLPPALSNDLCSLNENVDRLAFSCLMQLDKEANVTGFEFRKSLIRSRLKGVYTEVNALLDGSADAALKEKYAAVADQLPDLKRVYELLAAKRDARGSMAFDTEESKLLLNEAGRCVGVEKRSRGVSECIIEECMVLANGCAARLGREKELPFVYRCHEKPEAQRVENLITVLNALAVPYHFAGHTPTQTELSALLTATRGTALEAPVHTAILRTMAKADYQPTPLGHYSLALADYAHFTSPIRRYPDLAIHRILSACCEGMLAGDIRRRWKQFAEDASRQASARELAAQTAERDCEDCYKAEYMQGHLGEEHTGIITGVTEFGVYVMLPNTVEGLVRAEDLCESEVQLTDSMALLEPVSGRRWAVGDEMAVRVAAANVPKGQIDFMPAAAPAQPKPRR